MGRGGATEGGTPRPPGAQSKVIIVFVGGGPTRATRHAARSTGDVLTGCETQRLRVMDPNERYEAALSRTITFISLARPL